jgi:hypothetical protein
VKEESAKLQGAGISPKQCPRKCAAEKERPTGLSEIRREEQDHVSNHCGKNVKSQRCLRNAPSNQASEILAANGPCQRSDYLRG